MLTAKYVVNVGSEYGKSRSRGSRFQIFPGDDVPGTPLIGSLCLTSASNTDTIRVVSRDIKAGFIGLATSKFGHSAERIINENYFQGE